MRLHNRQIKATFWNDPDLLQWTRDKRWFYEGLSQLADDSGCLEDSPFAFKLNLFPSPLDTDITVDVITGWVNELIYEGKLIQYQANGKACIFIKNFHKHQALRSPAAPEVPLPPWVTFTPSEKTRRSGTYTIQEGYGNLTVTVRSGYSDQPEPEPEPEPEEEENIVGQEPDLTPEPRPEKIPFKEIIVYLNGVCGTNYKATGKKTKEHITARWSDGFRLDDFKKVITNKARDWIDDNYWSKFLRPSTLFGTKFEEYLNQKEGPPSGGNSRNTGKSKAGHRPSEVDWENEPPGL